MKFGMGSWRLGLAFVINLSGLICFLHFQSGQKFIRQTDQRKYQRKDIDKENNKQDQAVLVYKSPKSYESARQEGHQEPVAVEGRNGKQVEDG